MRNKCLEVPLKSHGQSNPGGVPPTRSRGNPVFLPSGKTEKAHPGEPLASGEENAAPANPSDMSLLDLRHSYMGA